jgi:hypothetical protein
MEAGRLRVICAITQTAGQVSNKRCHGQLETQAPSYGSLGAARRRV